MEDEEMSFDQPAIAAAEPATRKFSRLKRALPGAESEVAAQQQMPSPSALNATARALSDRTNTAAVTEQTRLRSPQPSPAVSSGAAKSSSSSPKQPSLHVSAASGRQMAQAAPKDVESQHTAQEESEDEQNVDSKAASQSDYWDSEDELEAALTRRERAEGFHADSATSSGSATIHKVPAINIQLMPACIAFFASDYLLCSINHDTICSRQRCTSRRQ